MVWATVLGSFAPLRMTFSRGLCPRKRKKIHRHKRSPPLPTSAEVGMRVTALQAEGVEQGGIGADV